MRGVPGRGYVVARIDAPVRGVILLDTSVASLAVLASRRMLLIDELGRGPIQ